MFSKCYLKKKNTKIDINNNISYKFLDYLIINIIRLYNFIK